MLFVNNLSQNGSHEQKLKFLPDACSGKTIGGMGMSESGAGTDVLGMSTTAVLNNEGTHYIINGSKMWITNGTLTGKDTGDIFLIYAKTGPGRGPGDLTSFLGNSAERSHSLFILLGISSSAPRVLLTRTVWAIDSYSWETQVLSPKMCATYFSDSVSQSHSMIISYSLYTFSVEKGTPGFTLGQKVEDKLGMRASMTAEIVFTDMEVSDTQDMT